MPDELTARLFKAWESMLNVATLGILTKVRSMLDALPPAPAGPQGERGRDGKDGRDGRDSDLTRAELQAEVTRQVDAAVLALAGSIHVEQRTLWVGSRAAGYLSDMRYRGAWVQGKTYDLGDWVSYGGSGWHANTETQAMPGDGSPDWTLGVKRGRDGRDARA